MLASVAIGARLKNGFGGSAEAIGVSPLSEGQSSGVDALLTHFLDADKDGSVMHDDLGMAGRFFR